MGDLPYPKTDHKGFDNYELNEEIYSSGNYYPEHWFSYRTGGGLDDGEDHVTYLVIGIYPIRYSPKLDMIQYVNHIELEINYELPSRMFVKNDEYDILIMAPESFFEDIQPLIDNNYPIRTTKLVSIEEILIQHLKLQILLI